MSSGEGHQLWRTCEMQRARLRVSKELEFWMSPPERDWWDTTCLSRGCLTVMPRSGRKHGQPLPLNLHLCVVNTESRWLVLISKGAKLPYLGKTCCLGDRHGTKRERGLNLLLLPMLSTPCQSAWTAWPTLGLLLCALAWPCASCVPGCAGSQLQHLTTRDSLWLLIMPFCWEAGARGLIKSLETSPTSFLMALCIFMQNVGGSAMITYRFISASPAGRTDQLEQVWIEYY